MMTSSLLKVPKIGIGTGAWGPPFLPVPQEQVIELVHTAIDSGQAFFDTAPRYANGLSEQWLGSVLHGVPRQNYMVASKVDPSVARGDPYYKPIWTRDGVLRYVETSLKWLETDTIDIVHIHDPDFKHQEMEALDAAFPVLADLRQQGVIRAIGAGVNFVPVLEKYARAADFDCFLLAGRYTLLEQGALGLLNLCQSKGIQMFLGAIFNTGILATGATPDAKYNYHTAPPKIMEQVRRIEAVCTRYNVPIRVAATQFPLAHPAVRSLVIGMTSSAEFSQAQEALNTPIPPELWADLRAEGLLSEGTPVPD